MRDGGRAIRVVSAERFSTTYPMTTEELCCHAKLKGKSANGYFRQLAILHITHNDATELTKRIKELSAKSTGSIILPLRQSDYTSEQAKVFTTHQCTVLAHLIPHDTSSPNSANREWKSASNPITTTSATNNPTPNSNVVQHISVVRTDKTTNPISRP